MPLQATSGAASYDAFGGGVPVEPNYIESVFSCFLYTGNGSTQTITNGIDLSTKGGLVWVKNRGAVTDNALHDSTMPDSYYLSSNQTFQRQAGSTNSNIIAFTTSGFSVGITDNMNVNVSANNYVSWTFRKQPKFFDVVTYTGTGSNTTIAHSLGSVPGSIIIKRTDTTAAWAVYHRSLANTQYLVLNTTAAAATGATWWNSTTPTSAVFSLGTDASVNASGGTYVAYIYAHDAGGFGLSGTDNVISCGSFTTDGSGNATVSVGYEPQWVMYKGASGTGGNSDWVIADIMRGYSLTGGKNLAANSSQTEGGLTGNPTATGFVVSDTINTTNIYIAIRRGPMQVPTLGTSVFQPYNVADTTTQTVGFPTDMYFDNNKTGAPYNTLTGSRLIGTTRTLSTSSTDAETTSWGPSGSFASNTTFAPSMIGAGTVWYSFRRAPGFFDEVCYTGNYAGNPQVPHNLGVAPEMLIARSRVGVYQWYVKHIGMSDTEEVYFNAGALSAGPTWVRTSTYWQYSSAQYPNDAHVAYLFATCPGVSKVGSYTGTATTLQIDCGFTAGARFVLIKRTDSTGDWYVWDSARGIVAGNDPYLLLNSTAAEVTSTDYVDTYSAGFEISSTAPAAINASGGTFIFLAIA